MDAGVIFARAIVPFEANYQRSLELLRRAKLLGNGILTKSGFMLGLGETRREAIDLMVNLREAGCDLITIGQYLPPSLEHYAVVRHVPRAEFEEYRKIGNEMGFISVASAPLVRSSFHAAETYLLAIAETVHSTRGGNN